MVVKNTKATMTPQTKKKNSPLEAINQRVTAILREYKPGQIDVRLLWRDSDISRYRVNWYKYNDKGQIELAYSGFFRAEGGEELKIFELTPSRNHGKVEILAIEIPKV